MSSGNAPTLAAIMLLTGIGIPVLAALNGGLGLRLGSPMAASVVLFGLAMLITLTLSVLTGTAGHIRLSGDIPPAFYLGGVFVAFYIISITFIAPRLGVGNAIFFVLVGQLLSAAVIDHFGLLGATRFPIDTRRLAGIALMALGVWLARRTG